VKSIATILCLTVFPVFALKAGEPLPDTESFLQKTEEARFRTSYETIPLSATRDMGIVGTHFDLHPFDDFKPFYFGLGFYSAASGEEGGFFAFGYTGGIDYALSDSLHVDAGAFLGGGAGEYINFPNGGMMLRSHLGLSYELDDIAFVLGVAGTAFPNSKENSDYENDLHPYAGINISNDIWVEAADHHSGRKFRFFDGPFRTVRVTPAVVMYDIDNKAVKRSPPYTGSDAYQSNFSMVGIQLDQFLTKGLFIPLEAYGAVGSGAGYAALQSGVGYDVKLVDFLTWESKMIVGLAGNGSIDTGGGLILQPMTGFQLQLTPSFSLKTLVGRTYAPTGTFSATTYEAGISWQAARAVPKRGTYLFSSQRFGKLKWSFSPSYKMYFPYDSNYKGTEADSKETIGLIGMIVAVPLTSWFSLTGSTHWAVTGNVGSYAEGLFGVQLSTPPFTPLKLRGKLQGEIGAGGGSGINNVSGGYITQALAGVEIPVAKHTGLSLNAGQTHSSDGTFKANTVLLAIDFNTDFVYKK
jgi:hypothetical protein